MISMHEREVAHRFTALQGRFKASLAPDDYRLRGVLQALGAVAGRRILDLGCGKGRFARALWERGAEVVGVDLSAAMLAGAVGLPRVRASARRLPLASAAFDAVCAVEVFEHLDPRSRSLVCAEARRVLLPGGLLVIVDKNTGALDARRPWLPSVLVKRIDEYRGRWMYPAGGPVRERWFWPEAMRAELERTFQDVQIHHLLAPAEEKSWLFRRLPAVRLMALWSARVPGGDRV